jgi:flagellar motor switch/type III secretory pathway protein FliN
MGGAFWGALGYALPFGFAAMLFGLVRKEVLDPRDEHLGSGAVAGLVRGAVGFYYGTAVGFAVGAVMIRVLRWIFPTVSQTTPTPVLHWMYVLGAATNPNVAFGYAFSTACLLAGSLALFSGRRDFTAPISDPKAPELTRPIEVMIPEVPDAPEMPFNMTQVAQESQSILQQFNAELNRVLTGPEWSYERYDLPPVGRPSSSKQAEPETTNVISARFAPDVDEEGVMGSLSDVYVEIVGDLGKLEIAAADWLCLAEGAILELPKQAGTPISVSINGKPAGRGVPVVHEGYKAVKLVTMRAEAKKDLADRMRG